MSEVITLLLLGLGAGSMISLSALGLVLMYRSSGVVNFSTGGIGMISAYVLWEFTSEHGWPVFVAGIASVLVAAVIGVISYVLVMILPRNSSTVTRVVGTLAILIILQSAAQLRYGDKPKSVDSFLPGGLVDVTGSISVPGSRLLLLSVAAVLTLVLAATYTRTTFGLATTAVSERPRTLAALGWRVGSLGAMNWAVGGALAGLAGVLLAPLIGASLASGTLLMIAVLAAALIGGLRSFPLTLAGGLLIGMLQSVFSIHDLGITGLADAIPLVVIILVISVRGRSLPLRNFVGERLPRVGAGEVNVVGLVLAVGVAVILITSVLSENGNLAFYTTLLAAIPMLSLTVVLGYAGQMSLAQLSLSGIGGLVAAKLTTDAGLPFLAVLVAAMLGAIPVGLLVGLPSTRTRGISLAITTLGLAVAIQALIFNNESVSGGKDGVTVSDDGSFMIFGTDFDSFFYPDRFALLILGFVVAIGLVVANLRRSASGRRMIAVRDNERAAAGLGINVVSTKLGAFAVASAIAGLGGALTVFSTSVAIFSGFTVISNITVVGYSVIGGVGSVLGALFGSMLVPSGISALILDSLISVGPVKMGLIGGILLIVTIVTAPDGLASMTPEAVTSRLRKIRIPSPRRSASILDAAELDGPMSKVSPATLSVRNVSVTYGAVRAVADFDLDVAPGEVVGVVGANGAGKTTLIDAITGFAPAKGSVQLGGVELESMSPSERSRAGLVRSWQSLELIEDLTVRDNLRVASDRTTWWALLVDLLRPARGRPSASIGRVVRALGLEELVDEMPEKLSTGQRKRVALARAIVSEPSILLLDEPCSGLDQHERDEVGDVIRQLADEWGVGVLLVEHDTQLVRKVSDRIVALDFGQLVVTGTPDEVLSHPRVISAYLGEVTDSEPIEASPEEVMS